MKSLLPLILLFIIGCKQRETTSDMKLPAITFDSSVIEDFASLDTHTSKIETVTDTVYFCKYDFDSLRRENDSLRAKLFVANYKIERVRYYLKICLRNPSQDKFLKGWVRRAID